MIDSDGYRSNVGIIVANRHGQVLWARRVGQNAWQFPQGGIKKHESLRRALYRELHEELGLMSDSVQIIAQTKAWLRYELPQSFLRKSQRPLCIGQKQRWFLLGLTDMGDGVRLDADPKPEFDKWKWVSYWRPSYEVVFFKRQVYQCALRELRPFLRRWCQVHATGNLSYPL